MLRPINTGAANSVNNFGGTGTSNAANSFVGTGTSNSLASGFRTTSNLVENNPESESTNTNVSESGAGLSISDQGGQESDGETISLSNSLDPEIFRTTSERQRRQVVSGNCRSVQRVLQDRAYSGVCYCRSVPRESCRTEPTMQCVPTTRTKCTQVPVTECKQVPDRQRETLRLIYLLHNLFYTIDKYLM